MDIYAWYRDDCFYEHNEHCIRRNKAVTYGSMCGFQAISQQKDWRVLLILAAVEAHQDNVLNDIAMGENNELEKKDEFR